MNDTAEGYEEGQVADRTSILEEALREIFYHGVTHPMGMTDEQYDTWTVRNMKRIAGEALGILPKRGVE